MSYDASFVLGGVRRGQFPRSARPFLLEGGALTNVSFVAIPADAEHAAGAQVVANLLLSPELQAIKADPGILGHPHRARSARACQPRPRSARSRPRQPLPAPDFGGPREELPAAEVAAARAALEAGGAARLSAASRGRPRPLAPRSFVIVGLFGGALAGRRSARSLVPLGGGVTLDSWRAAVRATRRSSTRAVLPAHRAHRDRAVGRVSAVAVAIALRSHGTALRAIAALPVPVPHLLVAVLAVRLAGAGRPRGPGARRAADRRCVRDELGLGVVLVYVYKETPFLVLLLLAAMGSRTARARGGRRRVRRGPRQRLRVGGVADDPRAARRRLDRRGGVHPRGLRGSARWSGRAIRRRWRRTPTRPARAT